MYPAYHLQYARTTDEQFDFGIEPPTHTAIAKMVPIIDFVLGCGSSRWFWVFYYLVNVDCGRNTFRCVLFLPCGTY